MPELATAIARNSPSAGSPATRSSTKKDTRIRLNSVSVFSRTIPATVRLEGRVSRSPRSVSRRPASASVSPASLTRGSVVSRP